MHKIKLSGEMREAMLKRVMASGRAQHLAPIVEALKSGIWWVIIIGDKAAITIPKRLRGRPFLATIGDDYLKPEGPSAFHLRSLRKVLGRAHSVYVMSGAPNPKAYEAAADGAVAGLNTVIVETRIEEELSWLDYVRRHAPKAAKIWVTPSAKELRNAV
jgi:hypothetical protein